MPIVEVKPTDSVRILQNHEPYDLQIPVGLILSVDAVLCELLKRARDLVIERIEGGEWRASMGRFNGYGATPWVALHEIGKQLTAIAEVEAKRDPTQFARRTT